MSVYNTDTENIKPFAGYSQEANDFLAEIRYNNNTAWFAENRQRFIDYLYEPTRSLIWELRDFFKAVDSGMDLEPAFGHALVRPNRDTRFSNDKKPYKEDYWCRFSRPRGGESRAEFYFWFSADQYGYGMGYYAAERSVMQRFREMILDAPEKVRSAFLPVYYTEGQERKTGLEICGDLYTRDQSAGKIGDPLLKELYNRKNLHVSSPGFQCDDVFFSGKLVALLKDEFEKAVGLYHLLMLL